VDGEPVQSLYGIWDPDQNYRRVLEAELLARYLTDVGGRSH